ncbi:MAG: TlpA family protein disulfide reductase [Pyrinomonadaceae bacterium]|nr:TlpA family protein disulfide reductase [Pyrinomonadaceae bacterium]
MKLTFLSLLMITFLPVFVFSQKSGSRGTVESYTKVGDKMPAFTVTDLDGAKIKIGEANGKVMLVNFWATWCPPCLTEMPRLENDVWNKYKSENFYMIAIAREQTDDEIKDFKKENRLSFPMAADPEREVYKLFGNGGIPRSYVVDGDGKILYQSVGYSRDDFDRMIKIIESQLKKAQKVKSAK